ncbi:MAG: hypothetical protein KAR47_07015, partial [Planctomycetes bacterium]|nr:hypothetical protein [Planctomycetota bacterium]
MISQKQHNSQDVALWLKLIRADGVGPTTFKKLLKLFGTVENILGASSAGLTKVDGIGARTADKIAASL